MKNILFITMVSLLIACNGRDDTSNAQKVLIDSLQKEIETAYKPGFGEFMSNIQVHHAKLWFAGQAENWQLAEFEVAEMKEALDGIQRFNKDRIEVQSIPMIEPAMDSVTAAINQKDPQLFKSSYTLLTNTCNNCHGATKHAFNVIQIPSTAPFSNQSFKVQ